MFSKSHITPSVFDRIKGLSFKDNCTVPLDTLMYLTVPHYNFDNKTEAGEIIVNTAIADAVLDIFKELFEKRYPIEHIRLIDEYMADDDMSMEANNSSAFNFRTIAGTDRLSRHATGLAIDINPLYNPYVMGNVVQPQSGRPYVDRSLDFPHKITHDDDCFKAFSRHGFSWGGDWGDRKDYQHLSLIHI